jgi:Ca-activated chloride channel family protein
MDVEDVSNGNIVISRLMKAKSVIENYMITHPENRYGLIIFAGTSRLVSPLTTEHSSLLTFLSSIDSKSIREGGTDFHQALQLALDRFETQESIPHTIVLLSDGGDTDEIIDTSSLKNLFFGKHASLITIGIGNTKSSPIPIGRNPL